MEENTIQNKSAEFTIKEWLNILSREFRPAGEQVVITGRFSRKLKINKNDRKKYFMSYDGIGFENGKEIRLVSGNNGFYNTDYPAWVINRLSLKNGSSICVTKRKDNFYLKKLELSERPSEIPGCYIFDYFNDTTIFRENASSADLQNITFKKTESLLSGTGAFRLNPLEPFKKMRGRIGFLARREFFGGYTKDDKNAVREYKSLITQEQLSNGSWENNTVTTAFNLIRLIEAGTGKNDSSVNNGIQWLVLTPEPEGFPGLFMLTEKHVERFNNWKLKQKRGSNVRSGGRRTTPSEIKKYYEDRDNLSCVADAPCELRLTWATGIVLEALLRSGRHDDSRTVTAINTLFAMSGGRSWCGCGYFTPQEKNFIKKSDEQVDFNKFPEWQINDRMGFYLFTGVKDAESVVSDGRKYSALDTGAGRSIIVKRCGSAGNCTSAMIRGLSFHPSFHGSNMESNLAYTGIWDQGTDGGWGDDYISIRFNYLRQIFHPVSALLVFKTLPLLIHSQRNDGLWYEEPKHHSPPPSAEESSFMILRTLKKFGFLHHLIPS